MPKLEVIIASTRPGRVGKPVGDWFLGIASGRPPFTVDVADLAEIALPFMDEPAHPRLRQYEHAHTRQWSARIDAADAFVFVMPEYNFGINAPLKNAIDYLHWEWHYKPVGLVSYGGVSAGTRAAQMVKQVISAVKMTPAYEAVSIPFVRERLADDGTIRANDVMETAARAMLDEVARLEEALRTLRTRLHEAA
jgi:NAD(P)H-dependent FMN reductase